MGPLHVECRDPFIVHTAPFGNWGVTSNFGQKQNSHQFQGWCHDTYVCDNFGSCKTTCRDGWYEWNGCTDEARYQPPNCHLYNAANCTEQVTSTGINVHGTQLVDVPVSCPAMDRGGCKDLATYSHGTNFLSLYELDPGGPDELVQTLYFPPAVVSLTCDSWGCAPAGSNWVAPSSYDSPASPPKVFAEVATAVNWGAFLDPRGVCRVPASPISIVSGASFAGPAVAPESIASVFGEGLAPITASAAATPLPTSLASTMVRVTDRTGVQRFAPLFYVSPGQVNFLVPPGTATGPATVSVFRGEVLKSSGTPQIDPVAPGLFAANANGKGVAAAVAIRVRPDGSQTSQLIFTCGSVAGSCTPLPIDLGPESDQVYLLLFGTGFRGRSSLPTVRIGGETSEVLYAGAQGAFVGLDQVNVRLPRSLAGRGEVDIVLTVDGRLANTVTAGIR